MIGFGIVIPVLPVYAKNAPFQTQPRSQLGWLTGIFSLVQLFAAPLIGKISDRIGRQTGAAGQRPWHCHRVFCHGLCRCPVDAFLGRIIDGASGGNMPRRQACIADVTKPEERSKAMGIIGARSGLVS
jgi:MFS family permease